MARPPEKLAQSLEILRKLQTAEGAGAIRARDLSRTHRERLLAQRLPAGSHQGLVYPEPPGRSEGREHGLVRVLLAFLRRRIWKRVSARDGAFRRNSRFRCMPATGPCPASSRRGRRAPATRSPNSRMARPCWSFASRCRPRRTGRKRQGLRLFSVESALIACSPNYFSNNATDVRAVLPMIRDASGLLAPAP